MGITAKDKRKLDRNVLWDSTRNYSARVLNICKLNNLKLKTTVV